MATPWLNSNYDNHVVVLSYVNFYLQSTVRHVTLYSQINGREIVQHIKKSIRRGRGNGVITRDQSVRKNECKLCDNI